MSEKNGAEGIALWSGIAKFTRAWIDDVATCRSNIPVAIGTVLAVMAVGLAIGYAAPFVVTYLWSETLAWEDDSTAPRSSPGNFFGMALALILTLGVFLVPVLVTRAITRRLLPNLKSRAGAQGPADWPVGFTLVLLTYGSAILGWIFL